MKRKILIMDKYQNKKCSKRLEVNWIKQNMKKKKRGWFSFVRKGKLIVRGNENGCGSRGEIPSHWTIAIQLTKHKRKVIKLIHSFIQLLLWILSGFMFCCVVFVLCETYYRFSCFCSNGPGFSFSLVPTISLFHFHNKKAQFQFPFQQTFHC